VICAVTGEFGVVSGSKIASSLLADDPPDLAHDVLPDAVATASVHRSGRSAAW
jgi:hypothetical protein